MQFLRREQRRSPVRPLLRRRREVQWDLLRVQGLHPRQVQRLHQPPLRPAQQDAAPATATLPSVATAEPAEPAAVAAWLAAAAVAAAAAATAVAAAAVAAAAAAVAAGLAAAAARPAVAAAEPAQPAAAAARPPPPSPPPSPPAGDGALVAGLCAGGAVLGVGAAVLVGGYVRRRRTAAQKASTGDLEPPLLLNAAPAPGSLDELRAEMRAAAGRQDFHRAASLADAIKGLEQTAAVWSVGSGEYAAKLEAARREFLYDGETGESA